MKRTVVHIFSDIDQDIPVVDIFCLYFPDEAMNYRFCKGLFLVTKQIKKTHLKLVDNSAINPVTTGLADPLIF